MKRSRSILVLVFFAVASLLIAADNPNTSYIAPPWKHTWGVRRATPFHLRLFAGNKTHFNNPQGVACVRLDAWDDTTKTGDDDEVTVYGVNSGDNCIIYNKSMYSIGIYGLADEHEKLNRPWGIAADASGNVYVADRGNARVVHLFNSGNELKYVESIGNGETGAGLVDPRCVALDEDMELFVTDAALGQVVKYDNAGAEIGRWNGFIEPKGIAAIGPGERWAFNHQSAFIVVCDSLNQRLTKLDLAGSIKKRITAEEVCSEKAEFSYPVIDYHGQIIITDEANGCLHKFDSDLNYISRFGKPGTGAIEFDQPRGIALHRRLGQLFVAEREGAQYLWVAVDVPEFSAEIIKDSIWTDLNIDFRITEPALAEIDIVDKYDRHITRIMQNRRFPVGASNLTWVPVVPLREVFENQKTTIPPTIIRGQMLPVGEYYVKATFRATYCSRNYFSREVKAKFEMR